MSAGGPVGTPRGKVDGVARVTGAARYTDDLRLPGMLHGVLLRSPAPHARITRLDLGPALAIEGVIAALTGADLPQRFGVIPVAQDETALAVDRVRYIGEPVVAIAAVDRATALRAAAAVVLELEPLPTVFTVAEALDPSRPALHEDRRRKDEANVLRRVSQRYGDPEGGFAQADCVLEAEYDYPGSTHVPLETHAALASADPQGRLTVWSSTQIPHYLHRTLARVLGLREQEVRVIKPEVGAGYGGKSDPFSHELCAAALALRTGRPVKFVLDREEVFLTHRGRHPAAMRLRMGATREGRITAADFRAWAPGGAYASYGVVTAYYFGVFLPLPYRLDHWQFEALRLYTNHPPCGPKRGHGAIQPRFALEVHMDRLAEALGLDPVELRLRNMVEPNTDTSNGLRITSVGLRECLERVTAASGWAHKRQGLPPGRGVGVAASAYMCGALHPVYATEAPQSAVQVCLDRSGRVSILAGTADIGQGSNDMLATLVAERLGIPTTDCIVLEGDTGLTPVDLGSYSSRVTFFAGNAALRAADSLRAQLTAGLAEKLGTAALGFGGGRVYRLDDPSRGMSFAEAVEHCEGLVGTLAAVGWYKPPKIGSRFRRQSVGPSPAYSFTAQVAEVEVDPETGEVRVLDLWVAHDLGRALNPAVAAGQVEGCVYMGVGEALAEEQAYRGGLHRAPSILEYKIPTVHETPRIHTMLVESGDAEGPLGAKEVGEGPQLSTVPAIANAIYHAVGVRLDRPPFTPERVLRALDRKARG